MAAVEGAILSQLQVLLCNRSTCVRACLAVRSFFPERSSQGLKALYGHFFISCPVCCGGYQREEYPIPRYPLPP
jgi:hypothetical protein